MAINRDKVLEAAQKFVEKKKYDKAVIELRKLVEADPNDARTLLKIGDLQAKQGVHADAINTYESVGKLYATQGFALKAIAVYKQIREIIAKHVPQLEERYGHIAPKLAELYQQLGLTSDALAALDEVATRLQRQQKDQEAIDVFRKIVELDPTNPLPHLRLAEALSRVKDVDGAVFEFKTAAQQLNGIGRRDDALKVLERLLHHKQDAEQAKLCAELYLSRGQPQDGMQALAKLQVCFQANPRDFDTLSLLARAFNAIGQGAKAIEVQKEMARVARDTGKMDLFREILERLNRVAPHDEGVRRLAQQQTTQGSVHGGEPQQAPPPPPTPEPPRFQPPPQAQPQFQQPQFQQPQFQQPPTQAFQQPPTAQQFQPPPQQAFQQPPTPQQFAPQQPYQAQQPPPIPPPRQPYQSYPEQPGAVYPQAQAEPQRNIPYVPPAPPPMPPQPGAASPYQRGATQPVPRGGPQPPPVHEIAEEEYGDYEEVVEDAEVVDEQEQGYEEQPEQETGGGFSQPQAFGGHQGGGFGQPQAFGQQQGGFNQPPPPSFGQARGAGGGFGQPSFEDPNGEFSEEEQAYGEPQADGNAEQGYDENDLPPPSGTDTAEMVNKALEDAAAYRRVRLYAKALESLRAGLDIEPRSMDLHEVYRDVLIESEQTDEAVEEMLVIASLYVDALDGDSAARALQDVLAFDPQNQRAIEMLQELGYEIVDENENMEAAQSLEGGDPYGEQEPQQQERLPSYDLEEMGPADVAPHYADDRQVHVGRVPSQAPPAYAEEEAVGGEALPSFSLDEEHIEAYEEEVEKEPVAPVRPLRGMPSRRPGPMSAPASVQPESAPELRASIAPPAFGRISMVPRSMSKPPPSLGAASRELEDALDEAEFFCSRGLFDDARAILTEQLSRHPNHPLLHERLAEIEAQDAQRGSGAREKPQDRSFDIAQSLDALESLDYANIEPAEGHANEEQQVDVEEVFAKFKEGVAKQISVDDSGAHYDLGIAYKEMMLLDDAIREFDTAARDPNKECVCRSMIGMIEIERGRVNEAIDSFLQGLNARNKHPHEETVLCYEIGAAYEVKKLNKDALSYFQKAMRRDPNYRDVQERVRRLARSEAKQPMRQAAVGDDEFDRAFDDLLSKA